MLCYCLHSKKKREINYFSLLIYKLVLIKRNILWDKSIQIYHCLWFFFNNKIKVVRHTIVFFKYLKTFLIIFIFLSLDNNQILSLFLQYSRVDAFFIL